MIKERLSIFAVKESHRCKKLHLGTFNIKPLVRVSFSIDFHIEIIAGSSKE